MTILITFFWNVFNKWNLQPISILKNDSTVRFLRLKLYKLIIYFLCINLRKLTIFPIINLLLTLLHYPPVLSRFIIIIFSSSFLLNISLNSRLTFFLFQKTLKRFPFSRNSSFLDLFSIAILMLIRPNTRDLQLIWLLDIVIDFIA